MEVVEGTVINVKPDEIALNIGYKSDGIITRSEYTNDSNADLTTMVSARRHHTGHGYQGKRRRGQVLLSYKRMLAERGNQRLHEAFENQEVLTAKVAQVVNGGLSVVMDRGHGFSFRLAWCPIPMRGDLSKYNGQEISFVITEFNPRRRRIIGDRKQLLIAQKAKMQEELFARGIQIGDVMEGTVKNVTDFGAFIDLGADGLLHISEISWGRVENPKRVSNPEMWSEYSSRIFMTRRSR